MEIFLAITVFVAGIIAAIGRTWDEGKRSRVKFTKLGYGAIVVGVMALIASIIVHYSNDKKQKELENNQKLTLGVSKGIDAAQKVHLEISQGITKRQAEQVEKQAEQVEISKDLTKKQVDQLEKQAQQLEMLSRLAQSQKNQIRLSENLTEEQRKQLRQLQQLRLDRDLSGVEISFKPSVDHWALIAHACDKIPPPSRGFPYSASTIMAERVGGYWEIEFRPIKQAQGSILPPPVSTNLPEHKVFEEVIDIALVELLIRWSNDDNLVSVISSRGNYPASITISKDMIAFTFRPPILRWGLNYLYAKPLVTFRGQQDSVPTQTRIPAPTDIRIRSLDYRVKFDQAIKLNWEEKSSDEHFEKWMPYISGPHHLNIDWSSFLR